MINNILVIGSGSWGLALSQVLTDNEKHVFVYGNNLEEISELKTKGTNEKFFGDLIVSYNKTFISTLDDLPFIPDLVLIVVPSKAINPVITNLKSYINNDTIILNATKGFDKDGKRISEIIRELLPKNPVLSLLGPSHAEEVIKRLLTFVNIIDPQNEKGKDVAELFLNSYFKPKIIQDEKGSELAVAMKNVVALMSGILTGLHYGDNARAALFSEGLREIAMLLKMNNCDPLTVLGLTGAGDLAVTCYSYNSRNFCAGKSIGELDSYLEFSKNNNKTVESIFAVKHLREKYMESLFPIVDTIYDIVYNNIKPSVALEELTLKVIV